MDRQLFQQAFLHARLKVDRANRHIDEAQQWFRGYLESDFCRIIDGTDAETGKQSIRAVAEPIPVDVVLSIGDAFHCLNSALDYVMSGLMRAKTGSATRISFPTDKTRNALRKSFLAPGVDASGRAKQAPPNRRIMKAFPRIAAKLLTVIKPYEGGDFALWEVRKADNIDKHNLIIPSITMTQVTALLVDEVHNNRITLTLRVGAGGIVDGVGYSQGDGSRLEFKDKGKATADISFPDGLEVFAGKPVFPTLLECSKLVSEAIDLIEQSARRYL